AIELCEYPCERMLPFDDCIVERDQMTAFLKQLSKL
ncbi:MAG: hypothetical protein RL552_1095, partial [Actinomycetota bacterium]